jgi:hypothetical protein
MLWSRVASAYFEVAECRVTITRAFSFPRDVLQIDAVFVPTNPAVDRLADDPVAGEILTGMLNIGRRTPCHQSGRSNRRWTAWGGGGIGGFVDRAGRRLWADLQDGRLFVSYGLGRGKTPGENEESESREFYKAHGTLRR